MKSNRSAINIDLFNSFSEDLKLLEAILSALERTKVLTETLNLMGFNNPTELLQRLRTNLITNISQNELRDRRRTFKTFLSTIALHLELHSLYQQINAFDLASNYSIILQVPELKLLKTIQGINQYIEDSIAQIVIEIRNTYPSLPSAEIDKICHARNATIKAALFLKSNELLAININTLSALNHQKDRFKQTKPALPIPNELIINILGFVDISLLFRLACLNTSWCRLLANNDLWKARLEADKIPFTLPNKMTFDFYKKEYKKHYRINLFTGDCFLRVSTNLNKADPIKFLSQGYFGKENFEIVTSMQEARNFYCLTHHDAYLLRLKVSPDFIQKLIDVNHVQTFVNLIPYITGTMKLVEAGVTIKEPKMLRLSMNDRINIMHNIDLPQPSYAAFSLNDYHLAFDCHQPQTFLRGDKLLDKAVDRFRTGTLDFILSQLVKANDCGLHGIRLFSTYKEADDTSNKLETHHGGLVDCVLTFDVSCHTILSLARQNDIGTIKKHITQIDFTESVWFSSQKEKRSLAGKELQPVISSSPSTPIQRKG